ncbi:hypothetical protein, partial [Flavobacterium sp.]|uniref:hypothetical protein n=1 Tax=Flavobacterium sp. TaxID=239 RepID=UPI0040342F16
YVCACMVCLPAWCAGMRRACALAFWVHQYVCHSNADRQMPCGDDDDDDDDDDDGMQLGQQPCPAKPALHCVQHTTNLAYGLGACLS